MAHSNLGNRDNASSTSGLRGFYGARWSKNGNFENLFSWILIGRSGRPVARAKNRTTPMHTLRAKSFCRKSIMVKITTHRIPGNSSKMMI